MSFNNSNTDILIAGAVAAFSIDLVVYPLDTIKTRFQSQNYKKFYIDPTTNSFKPALFRGLYQGVGSVILATVPSSGAFFTTYESTKTLLHKLNTSAASTPLLPPPIIHSAASCAGELVSCLILTPAEVLKQNAQMVQKPSQPATAFDGDATRQALKKFHHPSQLWRGYTALAGRNLPFTALQFPAYEELKTGIIDYRKRKGLYSGSLLEKGTATAIAAGTAGSVAAVVTTPVDVVKTRIMLSASIEDVNLLKGTEGLEKARLAARQGRAGALAVGREILRAEGMKALFRGAALRGAWTSVGSGLYLGVYESGRTYLEGRRSGTRDGESID